MARGVVGGDRFAVNSSLRDDGQVPFDLGGMRIILRLDQCDGLPPVAEHAISLVEVDAFVRVHFVEGLPETLAIPFTLELARILVNVNVDFVGGATC